MIHYLPKDRYVEIEQHVCEYHTTYPGKKYAGCTCSTSYSLKTGKRPLDDKDEWYTVPTVDDIIREILS